MSRFLQALKSLAGGRAAKTVVVEETTSRAALSLLRDVAAAVGRIVPDSVKSSLASFLGEKTEAELVFLTAAFLAVLLFVIILPAYEALFDDDESDDAIEDELLRSMRKLSSSPLRMYKPGVGVVEVEAEEVAETTVSTSYDYSWRSSNRSCGSMETIEESEEEYELEEKDEARESSTTNSVDKDVLEGKVLFTEEETVIDKINGQYKSTLMTEKTMEIIYGSKWTKRELSSRRTGPVCDKAMRISQ